MNKYIKMAIVLIVILTVLRFFFPPLAELGYANTDNGGSMQVMFDRNGGVAPMRLYVEKTESVDLGQFGSEICNSFAEDMVTGNLPLLGLNESGVLEVIFTGGGRYFFRLSDQVVYGFSYTPEGCQPMELSNG